MRYKDTLINNSLAHNHGPIRVLMARCSCTHAPHVDAHSHRITTTHTCAHHGVEGLFQLLLLQQQSTGHTLPLTVAASRAEETCQQDHQAPQRDLHRSAHPDRQRQRGAQQTEEFNTRSQQLEDLGGKTCGMWVQPAGERADRQEYCRNSNSQG